MDTGAHKSWIPDFDDNSPWRWEWWRVGLQPEDLFTTLAAQHNTVLCCIQDDEAFHHDVSDAAHEAENVDDFHARLTCRCEERLQELRKAWDSVAIRIVCSLSRAFGSDPTCWSAFRHLTSNHSLDSIVLFFNTLLPPLTPAPAEELLLDTAPVSPSIRGS